MKLAFVFPGQGSQAPGMLDGFSSSPAAGDVMRRTDAVLGYPLTRLIAEGPASELNLTERTQPAMLAASYAMYAAWIEAGGRRPDVMAGHSLGEYTALTAAGVFTLEEALLLVEYRARVTQAAVPVGEGAMAAVLGLPDEVVEGICAGISSGGSVVEPVNYNCQGQVVIAGHAAAVAAACSRAAAAGARRTVPLAVSGPFHSSLMKGAGGLLAARLAATEVRAPAIPVIANVNAREHPDPGGIRDCLARQVSSPVQWVRTVRRMQELGVDRIVECGPGKVLGGLVRRIAPSVAVASIRSPETLAAALEIPGMRCQEE